MEFPYNLDGHSVVLKAVVSVGKDGVSIMITYRVVVEGYPVGEVFGPFEIKASADEADRRLKIAAKMFSALKKAKKAAQKMKDAKAVKKVSFREENEVQEYMGTMRSLFFPSLFDDVSGHLRGSPYKVPA
jgi:hypothetical protein